MLSLLVARSLLLCILHVSDVSGYLMVSAQALLLRFFFSSGWGESLGTRLNCTHALTIHVRRPLCYLLERNCVDLYPYVPIILSRTSLPLQPCLPPMLTPSGHSTWSTSGRPCGWMIVSLWSYSCSTLSTSTSAPSVSVCESVWVSKFLPLAGTNNLGAWGGYGQDHWLYTYFHWLRYRQDFECHTTVGEAWFIWHWWYCIPWRGMFDPS